jgi:hypothetical protein
MVALLASLLAGLDDTLTASLAALLSISAACLLLAGSNLLNACLSAEEFASYLQESKSRPMRSDSERHSGLQRLINQVESEIHSSTGLTTLRLATGQFLFLGLICLAFILVSTHSWTFTILALTGPLLAITLVPQLLRDRERRSVARKLLASDLPLRLASGAIEPDVIRELMARGFGENYLDGARPPVAVAERGLAFTLHRIAMNLDWYLEPPRRLFRLSWLTPFWLPTLLLVTAGVAFALCWPGISGHSSLAPGTAMFCLTPLAIAVTTLIAAARATETRRSVWIELFFPYLRRSLAGKESGADLVEGVSEVEQAAAAARGILN